MNATENRPAVVGQVEPSVRPHSGDWMSAHEAERLAALWCAGQPLDDLPQWRTAMQVLVRELADTRAALKKANDMAEAEAQDYPGAELVPGSMQIRPLPESAAEHEHTSNGFSPDRPTAMYP